MLYYDSTIRVLICRQVFGIYSYLVVIILNCHYILMLFLFASRSPGEWTTCIVLQACIDFIVTL